MSVLHSQHNMLLASLLRARAAPALARDGALRRALASWRGAARRVGPAGPPPRRAAAAAPAGAARAATAAAGGAAPAAAPPAPAPAPGAAPRAPGPAPCAGAPTFQEAVSRLQAYWAAQGCALWLPHNTEVGAGTMNPATFLRVLGPEPWSVAYAEPSIRPDDSRYGDNPNRVQRHTQFQVILKPDPGNPQELYLGSLAALGVDVRTHDVRFVEDNWESPVLGAWGLGWEVWLDGMEVTQFTYFQAAGGAPLPAPAVEITYGLERILMALQGVDHFRDIAYAPGVTYGEVFLQSEYEYSVYNLDAAEVAGQRARFAIYEAEARALLARRLPAPAYDHLLKLSHAFNVLDARGAVGVTERAECFAAMRSLAREAARLWLARREEAGFPMGRVAPPAPPTVAPTPADALPAAPATFVLELGSEELPPDDLASAVAQLRERLPALLARLRLEHAGVEVEGTPRRVAAVVRALAPRQAPSAERVRGPPAKAAFRDGAPTPALLGFCKKAGVKPAACVVEADAKGVEYVWAEVRDAGAPAAEALAAELPALVAGLSFRKSMRWRGDATYSRPLRWLVALHGSAVVPFAAAGLAAGASTRLLRTAEPPTADLADADAYLPALAAGGIALGGAARRAAIWEGVRAAAAAAGGEVPESAAAPGGLLEEVSGLVESPTVVLGAFDAAFLELPRAVLVTVMRKHQRYFPVLAPGGAEGGAGAGALLPLFITVANGAVDAAAVRAGNEAVLRARFEDAAFFYRADVAAGLEAARPRLAGTTFHTDLGSLLAKSERVEALVPALAALAGAEGAAAAAGAAARLARADLATAVVTEMTELAGEMGRHYALLEGAPPEVAQAVYESVLPRGAGDALPESDAGALVAVADRLDSLAGLFAVGCAPTASADPYALRRAALGALQAVIGRGLRLDLRAAIAAAAAVQPVPVSAEARAAAAEFLRRRLEQLLVDGGAPVEAVRAALAERGDDAALASATARELAVEMAAGPGGRLARVMAAMARPTRLTRGKGVDAAWRPDEALMEADEERALLAALRAAAAALPPRASVAQFLDAAEPLVAPLDAYLDKVFVMCDDEARRRGRLALLRDVAALAGGVLDLSELPGF
jgi:glycyl-tRNA synthetase